MVEQAFLRQKMKKTDIIEKLRAFPYGLDDCRVITGGAMVLYGLREETSDIDLGCTPRLADRLEADGYLYQVMDDGNRWFKVGDDLEVFENWGDGHVVQRDGIPVISLQELRAMKQRLGREKDFRDIRLIDAFQRSVRIAFFENVLLRLSGSEEYEIAMADGKAVVSKYGIQYVDGEDFRVLEERAACSEERILELLNACHMLSWDGFSGKHPKGVLDGTMFRLEASVNGGRTVRADGSQNFPKHFRDFTGGLHAILRDESNSALREK